MERLCREVSVPQMANMLEQGKTPVLPPAELEAIGFKLAAYPLTLLSASIRAMQEALAALARGNHPENLLDFATLSARSASTRTTRKRRGTRIDARSRAIALRPRAQAPTSSGDSDAFMATDLTRSRRRSRRACAAAAPRSRA